jgi:hypothetical protein
MSGHVAAYVLGKAMSLFERYLFEAAVTRFETPLISQLGNKSMATDNELSDSKDIKHFG